MDTAASSRTEWGTKRQIARVDVRPARTVEYPYQPLTTAATAAVADHLRVDPQRELRVAVTKLIHDVRRVLTAQVPA